MVALVNNDTKFYNLEVDKENENTFYNDAHHVYWDKKSNLKYTSVTTLIHMFQDFDEEFWSSYKTIERLVTPDQFLTVKPLLLDKKKFDSCYLDKFGLSQSIFDQEKTVVLKEWEDKRNASCIRGTAIHKEQEMLHLAGKTKEIQTLKLGGRFSTNTSNKLELGKQGVYPELLLSRVSDDGKLRIAGQADLVIIDGKDVFVLDYKTGKSIDQKSFYDKKIKRAVTLKYPLNNIQDCNFMHYSLQLSTYAWMIQKLNPEFNIKLLMLIHYDHDGNVTNYECDYLKTDVERMLSFYKKQLEHEEFKRSREKITF